MNYTRSVQKNKNVDPSSIANQVYNEAAGAQKNMEVGRHLLPVPYNNAGTLAYKTDLTTATPLPSRGKCLAVYNNASSIGSVTLKAGSAPSVLASGACSATGEVGIACKPNDWTYIACGEQDWAIASANTLLCYLIDDNTAIKPEAVR